MEYMAQHHRDYAKLWIDPWYRAIRRNPPIWYRRLLLQAMLEVYRNWYKQMQATGEEFYLKIWLYDPHFINSQIVVAYRDFLHFYDQTFDVAWYDKKFPEDKYARGSVSDLVEQFDWALHVHTNYTEESDLLEGIEQRWHSVEYAEKVRRKAYQTTPTPEGDTMYSIHTGDVWVGDIKR